MFLEQIQAELLLLTGQNIYWTVEAIPHVQNSVFARLNFCQRSQSSDGQCKTTVHHIMPVYSFCMLSQITHYGNAGSLSLN